MGSGIVNDIFVNPVSKLSAVLSVRLTMEIYDQASGLERFQDSIKLVVIVVVDFFTIGISHTSFFNLPVDINVLPMFPADQQMRL